MYRSNISPQKTKPTYQCTVWSYKMFWIETVLLAPSAVGRRPPAVRRIKCATLLRHSSAVNLSWPNRC